MNIPHKSKQKKRKKPTILIVGDVMLDAAVTGIVERISPEAPIPIVRTDQEKKASPGGAANAAMNVVALGGNALLCGVIGRDEEGKELISLLNQQNINTDGLLASSHRITTTKTRVYGRSHGHTQHIARIDREINTAIDRETENKILKFCLKNIPLVDGLILSDYLKGVLTRNLCQKLIAACHESNTLVIADPKPAHIDRFTGSTILTPNLSEAAASIGLPIPTNESGIQHLALTLRELLQAKTVVITLGENGIAYTEGAETHTLPAVAKSVVDVTGAGDTTIAALAVSLCERTSLAEAVSFANYAASHVVKQKGTATVSRSTLSSNEPVAH